MMRSHVEMSAIVLLLALACGPRGEDPKATLGEGETSSDGTTSTSDESESSTDESESGTDESETSDCEPSMCEALIEEANSLAETGFSGVLGVVRDGEPLLLAAFGDCVRDPATPCTTDAVFDIGSVTKQFTAAAIMALVQDQELSVDDTLADHLEMVPPDKAEITIHQLLTHTAGLPEAIGDDYDPLDREAFLAEVFALPLASNPGEVHSYSNVGYAVLAAIIEQHTGLSYEEFLRQRLFEPAQMPHTGYVLPDFGDRPIAHGYSAQDSIGAPNELPWASDGPYWNLRGNGGLLSTFDDMIAWSEALRGDAVLDEAAKQAIFTPWVDEGFGDTFYGYGWVLPVGESYATHNGGNGYFFADYYHFLDDRLTIVVLSNVWGVANFLAGESLLAAAINECPTSCP